MWERKRLTTKGKATRVWNASGDGTYNLRNVFHLLGYSYPCVPGVHEVILNISDLAHAIGCPEHYIGKALFKGTRCGICFEETDTGVIVAGYAEGSDAECPAHELEYPFTIDEFWRAVEFADDEGCELWEMANGEDSHYFPMDEWMGS